MTRDSQAYSDNGPTSGMIPGAPLAQVAARGGALVAAGTYWQVGFGFIAGIFLTRLLPPEDFGVIAMATFFVQLLQVQNKVGLGYAFGQDPETTGATIGTYFTSVAVAALAGPVLVIGAAPILIGLGFSQAAVGAAVALSLVAVIGDVSGVVGTLLDKSMQFGRTTLIQAIAFPLSYVPAFWLATHDGHYWSLVAQTMVYALLLSVGAWWLLRRRLPGVVRMRWSFNRPLAIRYLRFGGAVGLGGVAALLVSQLDNFLVGTLVGLTVLGYYDRAYRIAQWPALLLNALVNRAAFYTYANLQGDTARLQKTVGMVLWLITASALPVAVVIFVVAPDLISLVYTDRWLPAAPLVRLLLIQAVARPLWENALTLFTALGRPLDAAGYSLAQAAVLAVTGIPLTLLWSAEGTCVAVALTFLTGVIVMYRDLIKRVQIDVMESLVKPLTVTAVTIACYVVLNRSLELNQVDLALRVLLKAALAGGVFAGLTLLIQPVATRQRLAYVLALVLPGRGARPPEATP